VPNLALSSPADFDDLFDQLWATLQWTYDGDIPPEYLFDKALDLPIPDFDATSTLPTSLSKQLATDCFEDIIIDPMCPGLTQRPPVDHPNSIDRAPNEPLLSLKLPGETQRPPVDNNNNNTCLTEARQAIMPIPNCPGVPQTPPADNTITNGEAPMHLSSHNSPGDNQILPVNLQYHEHSKDAVSPSISSQAPTSGLPRESQTLTPFADDTVPTWNLPTTLTQMINSPIPTITQSPK